MVYVHIRYTASGRDVKLLNDELVKYQEHDLVTEYRANEGQSVIKLSWKDWKTVRGIMIYNSYEYFDTFNQIDKIEFTVMNSRGTSETATITNLQYDWDWFAEFDWDFVKDGKVKVPEHNLVAIDF